MPIDPSFAVSGGPWRIDGVGGVGGAGSTPDVAPAPAGESFGGVLGKQLSNLQGLQDKAATAAQDLATGKTTDTTQVVMSVERARLAMQLASQLRTKGVEAINDIFHTQV